MPSILISGVFDLRPWYTVFIHYRYTLLAQLPFSYQAGSTSYSASGGTYGCTRGSIQSGMQNNAGRSTGHSAPNGIHTEEHIHQHPQ